jgi:prephenate dehydratase
MAGVSPPPTERRADAIVRVAYLGPPGTYTHEALLAFHAAAGPDEVQAVARPTIHDVVVAVSCGEAEAGVVPIENSLEGSVNATLDALAFAAEDVVIAGERVLAIHHCLIAAGPVGLDEIAQVASHPQALAQCAGFLRERLPQARLEATASTAEAIRSVLGDAGRPARSGPTAAALGPRPAAERYGGHVLLADVEDVPGNETRFARLVRRGTTVATTAAADRSGRWKTALAFWPRESDHPGWLVDCLSEFARRGVNLTRIESRPRKVGLGEYVFFVDLSGAVDDPAVAAGLAGVREHVGRLRVLGSFPAA